ncbi:hypothetical protein MMC25_000419 [Agyrium rufum]|nr:hypothetical protein [Agyrium rufum]
MAVIPFIEQDVEGQGIPEDQAILEVEFRKNSKPDKATRAWIVSQVTLGEKEVQIWFQNRRQIHRRKSLPLPNELSSSEIGSSQDREPSSTPQSTLEQKAQATKEKEQMGSLNFGLNLNGHNPTAKESRVRETFLRADASINATEIPSLTEGRQVLHIPPKNSKDIAVKPEERGKAVDAVSLIYQGLSKLCRRDNATETRKRLSLRLSMSFDGKAQLVQESDSSPAKPKALAPLPAFPSRRGMPLIRSQSEIVGSQARAPVPALPISAPARLLPGRSKDARTWEFYCDSDVRDALTIQAEKEQNGSAEAVIGLIRSSRMKSKVVAVSASRDHPQIKRKGTNGKSSHKPKLARTSSSVARLQSSSSSGSFEKTLSDGFGKNSPASQALFFHDSLGDSDKENWEPGTQKQRVRLPRSQGDRFIHRETLGENSELSSHSTSMGTFLEREDARSRRCEKEKVDRIASRTKVVVDDEVAAFMGESTESRGEEDLDCVQNLLSLSQGAWSRG